MNDYITCSGVTLVYNDEYVTAGAVDNSKFSLIYENDSFYIIDDQGKKICYLNLLHHMTY